MKFSWNPNTSVQRYIHVQNFLSNLYTLLPLEKVFKSIVLTFLENALNLTIFTHPPLPSQNSPPTSYHHSQGRGKLLFPARYHFFENLLPPTAEGVEETMVCFIKIQSENMKTTWNFRLLVFCRFVFFSNVRALQFCK